VCSTVNACGVLVCEDVEPLAYSSSHRITQIQGVREEGAEGRLGSRKTEVRGDREIT
jgi:hypothetical protein